MRRQCMKSFSCLFIFLLIFTGCQSRTVIVNGLDEKEANEILVFLSSRGIKADKVASSAGAGAGVRKEVLWDIEVRSDQASEALSLLNQYGLPRKKGESLLGIFKQGSSLVPSAMQETVKYQQGLADQIANTLTKIDGILDAEVLISYPKENPLNPLAKKEPITAAVFIKHNGVLDDPNLHLESKIKRLVAASVTGLNYNNVTVVGTRARLSEYGLKGQRVGEEQPFVDIWSILIAKESLGVFRTLFFSFILLILLLLLLLIWVGWKIYPFLQEHGGLRSLFTLQPIPKESPPQEEAAEEKVEEKPSDEEEKGPPSEVT
jgi:type III secretion protein J